MILLSQSAAFWIGVGLSATMLLAVRLFTGANTDVLTSEMQRLPFLRWIADVQFLLKGGLIAVAGGVGCAYLASKFGWVGAN